jgi:hypothetical protein
LGRKGGGAETEHWRRNALQIGHKLVITR